MQYLVFKYFSSFIFCNFSQLLNICLKSFILFLIINIILFSPFFNLYLLINLLLSPFIFNSILLLFFFTNSSPNIWHSPSSFVLYIKLISFLYLSLLTILSNSYTCFSNSFFSFFIFFISNINSFIISSFVNLISSSNFISFSSLIIIFFSFSFISYS